MNKLVIGAALGVVCIALLLWILTIPAIVPASELPPYTPNISNGKTVFYVGGCTSCHATPNNDPKKIDSTRLGGGLALTLAIRHLFSLQTSRRMRLTESAAGARLISSRRFGRGHRGAAASVSGFSLHLVPAHAACRCARSLCLFEDFAAGNRAATAAQFGVSFQRPPAGRVVEAAILPWRAFRSRCGQIRANESRRLPRQRPRSLRRMSQPAQFSRRHRRKPAICRRADAGR